MVIDKVALASSILERGKVLAPDRFPAANEETITSWGRVLGAYNFPPALWADAVDVWAAELVGERMCTPREIIHAARIVRSRWESDPVRGPQLKAHRERLADERDRLISEGKFGVERGYRAAVEAPRPDVPDFVSGVVKQLRSQQAG